MYPLALNQKKKSSDKRASILSRNLEGCVSSGKKYNTFMGESNTQWVRRFLLTHPSLLTSDTATAYPKYDAICKGKPYGEKFCVKKKNHCYGQVSILPERLISSQHIFAFKFLGSWMWTESWHHLVFSPDPMPNLPLNTPDSCLDALWRWSTISSFNLQLND